ncbi:unnamed protein product [Rotaria sp. Silwood2]|nr:unnamed protein product [Rotaria sp. Silwood2]
MHIIVHIIFTVLFLGVVLHGQGAGGGRHGHGGSDNYEDRNSDHARHAGSVDYGNRGGKYGGGNRYGYITTDVHIFVTGGHYNRGRQRPHATTDHHSSLGNMLYFILFLVTVVIIGCCIGGCCLIYRFKTRSGSNTTFTNVPTNEPPSEQQTTKFTSIPIDKTALNNMNIFSSGIWSGRYFQYGRWHDPQQLSLSFDPNSFTINGHGSDDVGAYTVTGRYSTTTNEIELEKTYQQGTGDERENFGHLVTIEVTWNPEKQLFDGNWYVDKSSFRDEDLFELKFEKSV